MTGAEFDTGLAALVTKHGWSGTTPLLSWLAGRLEFADRHDARTSELLEASNRSMQEARDARAEARSWKHQFEMYARAWERELGGGIIRKAHLIDALVLSTRRLLDRARAADHLERVAAAQRSGIYIASKVYHAEKWRLLRAAGLPIASTWIDEAGAGESADLDDLWQRCIREASTAQVLIVYREPGDTLKGAWIEVGAALASGVPVYAAGIRDFTVANDRRITHFDTLDAAVAAARATVARAA